MALLRKGHLDINTEDPALINQAVADLKELYDICNIKVGDIQYQSVPEGTSWLNQAWSGDMIAGYIYYLPKGTPATALAYWKADKGKVPVQNDCFSICATTKKPVLSHLFLNYLLDNGVAYSNFVDFNGYQPPLNEIDPESLVKDGVVPENLANSVLTKDDFGPDSLAGDDPDRHRPAALGGRLLRLPGRRRRLAAAVYRRWLWPSLSLPGVLWLIVLFVVPFYAVLAVSLRHGRPDPLPAGPDLEPARMERRLAAGGPATARARGHLVRRRDPDDRLRGALARALPADRLSGRLLHGPARRAAGRA